MFAIWFIVEPLENGNDENIKKIGVKIIIIKTVQKNQFVHGLYFLNILFYLATAPWCLLLLPFSNTKYSP